ncbi:MAG: hypothetical protein R2741_12730 [Methanolobus sp.]
MLVSGKDDINFTTDAIESDFRSVRMQVFLFSGSGKCRLRRNCCFVSMMISVNLWDDTNYYIVLRKNKLAGRSAEISDTGEFKKRTGFIDEIAFNGS